MECSCTASCDAENYDITGYSERKLNAAKRHICRECKGVIKKGEQFVFCTLFTVDGIQNYKMCLDCHQLTEAFFSNGFYFTQIHKDLELYLEDQWTEDLPSQCISKLSPRAQGFVCDILQKFQEKGE